MSEKPEFRENRCKSISIPTFYTDWPISMKFGTEYPDVTALYKCEYCENRLNDTYASLKGAFAPFSTFLIQFRRN